MVRWLPRAAADAPSGSRHWVSRVRRVRGHPTARARHARMSRRPRHARTRQRAHSPTHLHDNAQARHKHISAHCASLTPPTAALLGAGGRMGTPATTARSTRRPRGPGAWIFTPIRWLQGVMITKCNFAAAGAAGMGRRVAWRATAFSYVEGCGRWRASRELAREPRASARKQRAVHGMLACACCLWCVHGGAARARGCGYPVTWPSGAGRPRVKGLKA